MKRFKKILVATDSRSEEHPVVETAAEFASINGSTLTIVDVIPEIPWILRLSLGNHEHLQELHTQEKLAKLEGLAEPLRNQGLVVETKILRGKASVEIVREVLRDSHDLVIAVAKGANSHEKSFFGQTGKRLLRKCPCAVWLVTGNSVPKFGHVLSCIETSSDDPIDAELNEKIYALGKSFSEHYQGKFSVVQAWSVWNEGMLKNRLTPREYEETVRVNRVQTEKLFDAFLQNHDSSGAAENVHLVKAEAISAIPQFASEYNVDLVVMGTVARSGLTGVVMGNTAEKILDRLECSVLAVKPIGFRSPITEA